MISRPGLYKFCGAGEFWVVWDKKLVLLDTVCKKGVDGSYAIPVIDSLILVKFRKKGINPVRVYSYENNKQTVLNLSYTEFARFILIREIDASALSEGEK
jgi:hypothetical protein